MKFASPTLHLPPPWPRYAKSLLRHASNARHNNVLISHLPPPRLDYKSISENTLYKSHNSYNRKAILPVGAVQSIARLYAELKTLSSELNLKLALRNFTSNIVHSSPHLTNKIAAIEQGKALKSEILELKSRVAVIELELLHNALPIPNDTHPDTPIGPEAAAVTLSTHGPHPLPITPLRDHVRVARALRMLELDAGSTVTGSSWYYLLNEGALLDIALVNYSLSVAIRHGYRPVITPDVVKADVAMRCGFQPRDPTDNLHQMYHLSSTQGKDHPELVLSGTAEIPLAGLFANKVFEQSQLPKKVVGVGKAFRAEAGARGTDTRGLYRVHQFSKVELFAVTPEAHSAEVMEDMKKTQVEILEGLKFPFRVLDMPTEELGASAYRKYDIEAWMPGRGRWGEVTSTSNCTDYQSRRLHIRYRRKTPPVRPTTPSTLDYSHVKAPVNLPLEKQPLLFAHTLNGTAAAVPRLIVALLENGVRLEGDDIVGLDLPNVLRPFWVGSTERNEVDIRWI
ncbi:seryl-tRNA synthetase [Ramaria rubella]|nr:seryl-tRNA synthetase [Ramaria rubella]